MPFPGTVWATGTWDENAWAANTWQGAVARLFWVEVGDDTAETWTALGSPSGSWTKVSDGSTETWTELADPYDG